MKKILIISALALSAVFGTQAKISLPAIISDNMVLQQDCEARLWGKAAPGEKIKITASWAPKTPVSVTAGADGLWSTAIATPAARMDGQSITFRGKNTLKVKNVLGGEVWLSTGQSNRLFPVGDHRKEVRWQTGMADADTQLTDADYPQIRFFTVPFVMSPDRALDDCEGRWVACTPETAYDFSAVGFVFGRRLFNELKVPVGLILAAKGDTHAESWMKPELMQGNPFYDEVYEQFGFDKVEKSKKPFRVPSTLWNGMISPVLGYTVAGNIWYQGEANDVRPHKYQAVFTSLIDSWRREWKQPDMPFYFVQIAPYRRQPALLREAQLDTWQSGLKNIGMVVTTDCGDSLDIHPRNKVLPGERLAAWALAKDYGRDDVAFSGPLYRSMRCLPDSTIELCFDYADGGLRAPEGEKLHGFEVAGPDRVFVPATVRISGPGKLSVSAPGVAHPVAVRYGWGTFFRANLFNGRGLPASPFRTDRWPQ